MMKKLILAAVLAAVATPSFACGWSKSASTSTRDTVATETPQTPIPAEPKG
jgi:hypothetical protein